MLNNIMKNRCPKCGTILKNSSRAKKAKDSNLLSLILLFGNVSLKNNKKAACDLCGCRLIKSRRIK